jgi:hypothetical protein
MDVTGERRAWIAAIRDHTTLAIRDPDPIRNEMSGRADTCPGCRVDCNALRVTCINTSGTPSG